MLYTCIYKYVTLKQDKTQAITDKGYDAKNLG